VVSFSVETRHPGLTAGSILNKSRRAHIRVGRANPRRCRRFEAIQSMPNPFREHVPLERDRRIGQVPRPPAARSMLLANSLNPIQSSTAPEHFLNPTLAQSGTMTLLDKIALPEIYQLRDGFLTTFFYDRSYSAGPEEVSVPFLLDQNPDVASVGMGRRRRSNPRERFPRLGRLVFSSVPNSRRS
jgi:hypothetical protein